MRDFYFFTSNQITAKDCFEALKNEIKNVEMNGETDIWINAKSRSFIWFSNDTIDDFFFESPEEKEEFKKKIPIENPYVTDFETHRSIDLKRVIKEIVVSAEKDRIIAEIFPDMEYAALSGITDVEAYLKMKIKEANKGEKPEKEIAKLRLREITFPITTSNKIRRNNVHF